MKRWNVGDVVFCDGPWQEYFCAVLRVTERPREIWYKLYDFQDGSTWDHGTARMSATELARARITFGGPVRC